jgi:hypothetical protein
MCGVCVLFIYLFIFLCTSLERLSMGHCCKIEANSLLTYFIVFHFYFASNLFTYFPYFIFFSYFNYLFTSKRKFRSTFNWSPTLLQNWSQFITNVFWNRMCKVVLTNVSRNIQQSKPKERSLSCDHFNTRNGEGVQIGRFGCVYLFVFGFFLFVFFFLCAFTYNKLLQSYIQVPSNEPTKDRNKKSEKKNPKKNIEERNKHIEKQTNIQVQHQLL